MLSKDANGQEGTITIYSEVVSALMRRYATDAVVTEANQYIWNVKQDLLTSWDFLQTLWDLFLQCVSVYN